MSNLIEQDEYLILKTQLESSKDYRNFIDKNSNSTDVNIKYLLIKAAYLLVLEEKNELFYILGLRHFIKNNSFNVDNRVRALVVDVTFKLLKAELPTLVADQILDEMNKLLEYASSITGHYNMVSEALIYIYWFKAQNILDRDWRKTQYFYNKIILLVKGLNNSDHSNDLIKAQLAKLILEIQFDPSPSIEQKFYDYIDLYLGNIDLEVKHQVQALCFKYIIFIFNQENTLKQKYFKKLLKEIDRNANLKQLVLSLVQNGLDLKIILFIGQQYWLKNNKVYEEFFFKYFEYKQDKDQLQDIVKEYLEFESTEQLGIFVKLLEDLYERYVGLNKYRKLFKIHQAR